LILVGGNPMKANGGLHGLSCEAKFSRSRRIVCERRSGVRILRLRHYTAEQVECDQRICRQAMDRCADRFARDYSSAACRTPRRARDQDRVAGTDSLLAAAIRKESLFLLYLQVSQHDGHRI